MGDPKIFRNPDSLRSQIGALGDAGTVKAELQAIIAGPPKATAREFAVLLGKLTLHFWSPNFTPEQAREKYGDFIRLLDGVTPAELREACDEWVMDPLNRFFPTPGQLHELMRDRLTDRKRMAAGAEYLLTLLASPSDGDQNRGGEVGARLHALAEKMSVR